MKHACLTNIVDMISEREISIKHADTKVHYNNCWMHEITKYDLSDRRDRDRSHPNSPIEPYEICQKYIRNETWNMITVYFDNIGIYFVNIQTGGK